MYSPCMYFVLTRCMYSRVVRESGQEEDGVASTPCYALLCALCLLCVLGMARVPDARRGDGEG